MKYLNYCAIFLFIFLPIKIYGAPTQALIIFSGEELGNLEPCGCYEGQIGGISRRHTFINSFVKQKNIILPVSLGDLSKGYGRQEEIKMEILSRAMQEMGYVLHSLGEKDIETGLQLLSYLSQVNNTTFLASNVKIIAPFPMKVHQYFLKEYSHSEYSFKIAFLSILSKSFSSTSIANYVNIYEPIQALKPLIKRLHDKVNIIVLLSHTPKEESIEIAKFFPEIDLIITGHDIDDPQDSIIYVNNIPIVSPGKGGKYIGIAKYSIQRNATKRMSVDVIPLDRKYKDSEKMTLLLEEYQRMLKEEDLLSKVSQVSLSDGLAYVGSSACGICHKMIYDHWSKTAHGVSYETLVYSGHQYDPECIKCHTTGYGYVSGFLNYEENQNLINVGCESCHGAGSLHIRNINETSYGLTDENICETCHDSEHSPGFERNEYWRRIIHPEETLTNLPKVME